MSAPRRPLILGVVVAAVAVLPGCGGGGDGNGDKSQAKAKPKCESVAQPEPRRVKRRKAPDLELSPQGTYKATVETSCGDFTIALDGRQAPRTGGSFVTLARDGFYDDLTFHRVVPGFVIQGGDPRGDGSGGPGYTVRERPPSDVVYSEGVV